MECESSTPVLEWRLHTSLQDGPGPRALPSLVEASDTMTLTRCEMKARARGQAVYGVEYGRECYAGEQFASECFFLRYNSILYDMSVGSQSRVAQHAVPLCTLLHVKFDSKPQLHVLLACMSYTPIKIINYSPWLGDQGCFRIH